MRWLSEHGGEGYFPDEVGRLLAAHKERTAAEICERLRESLLETPRQDDVTAVVVKYVP